MSSGCSLQSPHPFSRFSHEGGQERRHAHCNSTLSASIGVNIGRPQTLSGAAVSNGFEAPARIDGSLHARTSET